MGAYLSVWAVCLMGAAGTLSLQRRTLTHACQSSPSLFNRPRHSIGIPKPQLQVANTPTAEPQPSRVRCAPRRLPPASGKGAFVGFRLCRPTSCKTILPNQATPCLFKHAPNKHRARRSKNDPKFALPACVTAPTPRLASCSSPFIDPATNIQTGTACGAAT